MPGKTSYAKTFWGEGNMALERKSGPKEIHNLFSIQCSLKRLRILNYNALFKISFTRKNIS